jgi:plasmid stabilization system protein ParE
VPNAVWTPQAHYDVEQILYYVRVESGRPLTAQRIGEELLAAVDAQAASSFHGARHPAAPPEWRYLRHKRWLVFFQQGIEVMRVVDGARDLPRVLADLLE